MSTTIDLRGASGPANVVRAKLALAALPGHEAVGLTPSDGEAVRNVPLSLEAEGHRLIGLKQSNEGHYILELKKAGH